MRSFKRTILSMVMALTVVIGTMSNGLIASAADSSYTPVIGGADAASIDKYFVVDKNTNVPPVTFTFGIAPGTPVAITATTPEIKAGPAGAKIVYNGTSDVSATISFDGTSTTYDSVQDGHRLVLPADYKYVSDTFTVDLSGVTFTELGIYRYVITETGTNAGVINDTRVSRYVDVYVVADDDDPTKLVIPDGGIIVHPGDDVPGTDGAKPDGMPSNSDPVGDEDGDDEGEGGDVKPSDVTTWKPIGGNDSYVNVYGQGSNALTINSVTDGNQGDKDKVFTYVVTITNPTDIFVADKVVPTWNNTDEDVTVTGTVTDSKVYTVTITMPDGKSVEIDNIPNGATVVTNVYSDGDGTTVESEGYAAKHQIDTDAAADGSEATVVMNKSDHTINWTLTKAVKIPTGIYVRVLPFILLAVGAVAVLVAGNIKRKRHE